MNADQTGPPEIKIVEVGLERLGAVESLWRAMHDYHAEVADEARKVAPFRDGQDAWQRRRTEFVRWMRTGEGY